MAAIAERSIQQVAPGLYTSQGTTQSGHPIHFGFEKLDSANLAFWQCYVKKTEIVANYLHYLSQNITATTSPAFLDTHSVIFGGDEEQFNSVVQLMQTKKHFEKTVFQGIGGGTFGMDCILGNLKGRSVFVVYASDRPVEKRHTMDSKTAPTTWAEYRAAFGDVVMSFACITAEDPATRDDQLFNNVRKKAIDETVKEFGDSQNLNDGLYNIAFMVANGSAAHFKDQEWEMVFKALQVPEAAGKSLLNKLQPAVALPPPATAQTVTHFGIFKNPIHFLQPVDMFPGISPDLHGFSAANVLEQFPGAKYMVTNPLDNMAQILATNLGPALHLGTNIDLQQIEKKSEKQKEGLKSHPPIMHIDSRTGIQKIAKEGVDLSQHLDTLPDELADVIVPPYSQLDFSPCITMGGLKAVIRLESLAKLFDKE